MVTGLIGGWLAAEAELRDAQRTSHDPQGSQELAPPYFFSPTAERDDLRDTISDTSQCAVSTNDYSPLTNHYSPHGLGRGVGRPLGVGTLLGVGVGRGVGVAVGVAVGGGVTVGVGVLVGVGVADGDAVGVGVGVGACPPGNTRT